MKLYEILLRKIGIFESPVEKEVFQEDLIYNPIGCKIGGVVKIDAIDYRDHRFAVKEIQEYSLSIGGNSHRMVDYHLLARPIGQDDFNCCLRVVPDLDSKSKTTHRALLLTLYDDLAYNDGLHEVVKDETKKFIIHDDTDPNAIVHDEFWRVNDVGVPYVCKIKTLRDSDKNGKVEESEVVTSSIEFWDYSRETDIECIQVEEFVFVEMSKKNGWFKIWRGSEVNPERIEVF